MNVIQSYNKQQLSDSAERQSLMFHPFNTYKKKQIIYLQGEKADHLYLIKSGAVKLLKTDETGDQVIYHILGEGDIFGEWNRLLDTSSCHQYSAIALNNQTTLSKLKTDLLSDASRKNAFIELSAIFMKRVQLLERKYYLLAKSESAYRVKETLKDLGIRYGIKVGSETLLKVNVSHQDLALLADTSRQTVTTVLNQMRSEGKIYYTRDRILFRNLSTIHQ